MKIIGHRGAMEYEPENTLLSFQKAYELNCSAIELDVFCVQDKLLVFHDDKLNRTTNGKGFIWNNDIAQLRLLDAGKGQKIPFLEEVIEIAPLDVLINVELKGIKTAKPVSEILAQYPNRKFIVSSFNHKELLEFEQLSPNTPTGILLERKPISLERIVKKFKNAISVNPGLKFVNKKLVDECHNLGYEVYVWTVNEMKDFNKMREIGVDGIFSNCPDKFLDL